MAKGNERSGHGRHGGDAHPLVANRSIFPGGFPVITGHVVERMHWHHSVKAGALFFVMANKPHTLHFAIWTLPLLVALLKKPVISI
jgi:hypothetical protein